MSATGNAVVTSVALAATVDASAPAAVVEGATVSPAPAPVVAVTAGCGLSVAFDDTVLLHEVVASTTTLMISHLEELSDDTMRCLLRADHRRGSPATQCMSLSGDI